MPIWHLTDDHPSPIDRTRYKHTMSYVYQRGERDVTGSLTECDDTWHRALSDRTLYRYINEDGDQLHYEVSWDQWDQEHWNIGQLLSVEPGPPTHPRCTALALLSTPSLVCPPCRVYYPVLISQPTSPSPIFPALPAGPFCLLLALSAGLISRWSHSLPCVGSVRVQTGW